MAEQAKFTYSHLGNDFEKQIKTIEDQGKEHIEAVKLKFQNQWNITKNQNQLKEFFRKS